MGETCLCKNLKTYVSVAKEKIISIFI